ncbi:hypothetical protein JCGZ_16776 [Jatropha curcas]|uniref:Uncharacterized protein n=2 Tax=Jatropha curcas TaxID=180498 RepID=A0A067LH18_JATCU|nr:hypothetical protein JCGZ_16776 [Jatropha curcas]
MAEAVLFNIVDGIITKLSSTVLREIGLWWGVKDELQELKRTVSMIQPVLLDAEEKYSKSRQVEVWLGTLKEAVYDAEDLLDIFSTEALKQKTMTGSKIGKEVTLFFSSSNQFAYGLDMAHTIKSIRERLDEIAKNRQFHLEQRPVEKLAIITREREQTHSSSRYLVGRGDDKKAIMKVLLCTDSVKNVSVISIVGIGGLGKTALAQLLLNDKEVKNHFELKLWVCVAENFDTKSILEKILEDVKGEKLENLEMNTLQKKLHETIDEKRFILVLDDVWNEDSNRWFSLMDLLVGGAKGSKIIITTRSQTVARIARSDFLHELGGLRDAESWELFKQVGFKKGQVPSRSLEETGKKIVKKCVGVPLAIKTIGSLFYLKDDDEWTSFMNKELSSINQPENDILPTLRLSYNHLPSHLKHCFAYCRSFPKDYEINVKTLIELWIAQGFVRSSNATQSLKDVGLQYFKELFWRSFFQEVKEDDRGNIKTCKMHDLMHDLAISVAEAGSTLISSNSNVDERTRHISVDLNSDFTRQKLRSLLKASKARTFLFVNKSLKDVIGEEECCLIFSNLKCLRALDLHGLGIETVPSSINKLELLRYLDLSYNNSMKKLPNSISRLPNLQVLKVDRCEELEELPKDIKKLVNLTDLSLFASWSLTHMPHGVGQLTGLETLSIFTVDKRGRGARLSELKDLNNLRGELSIQNLQYVKNPELDFCAANLKEKQHLQYLQLWWKKRQGNEDGNEDFAEDIDNDEMALEVLQPHQNLKGLYLFYYRGVKLSSWLSSLTNLVELRLNSCKNIQCLPPFDQFPSLKRLKVFKLTNLEYIESGISCNNGGFPSLKLLDISECPNLKGWRRCEKDTRGTISSSSLTSTSELPKFHCLSNLSIGVCPNLTSLPPFPSIENLYFRGKTMKPLDQLLESTISGAESTSSSPPLSQLKQLTIQEINDGAFLPGKLQQKLTSLSKLYIVSCPRILEMECQGLRSLNFLCIRNIDELVSLPKWLQYLSTLRSLKIKDCPKLMSLPEWMSNLTSLRRLTIENCPQLSERCRRNKVEDWPKISHIPIITIDSSRVQ